MRQYDKIISIDLDSSTGANLPDEIEHEQLRAINDLLEENEFRPLKDRDTADEGPYKINLKSQENKLVIEIYDQYDNPCHVTLGLKPFNRIMKDYKMVCDSYYKAIKQASPQKIEALDMGRRGLHDEGAEILLENLKDKIECDFKTARRLFTLIYILFLPGLR